MNAPSDAADQPQAGHYVFGTAFTGIMLAVVVSSLDQNIVAVALPHIAGELGGIEYIPWIVTAFLLTATISAPIYGKLSDIYGRRRLLTASMSLFLATTLICSLARSMPQLVTARALQGLGAGGLMTLSQSAIGDLVGPRHRGRYQGYFSAALATSTVLGPLVGGALIRYVSWRCIFLVAIPVGVASLVLLRLGLRPRYSSKSHVIDYTGTLLLAVGTSAALLLFNSLGSHDRAIPLPAIGLGAVALACGILFIRQEHRAQEPLLDLDLFRNGGFLAAVIAAAMMTFAMQAAMVFLPLYFQEVQGMTPAHSGFMLIAQVSGMIVSSVIGGHISARTGRFKSFLILGVAMEALALAAFTLLALTRAGALPFLGALGLLGLGTGLGMPNAIVIIQNSVQSASLGVATSAMSFLRSLGGAFGVALSGCVMHFVFEAITQNQSTTQTHILVGSALRPAIAASFALGAAMMLLALLTIALKLPSPPRH